MATRYPKDPKELNSLINTSSGGDRSYQSTEYSLPLESEEDSPRLKTSVAASVQFSTPDPTKSQMVVPTTTSCIIDKPTPQATAQPSQPDYLSGQQDSNSVPGSRREGNPRQCTEEDNGVPICQPSAQTRLLPHPTPRLPVFQRLQNRLKSHPRLCTTVSVCTFVGLLLVIACGAVLIFIAPCKDYSTNLDILSNDTFLIVPNIDTSCHSDLFASSTQDDSTVHVFQLYTGKCEDVCKHQETLRSSRYGYKNLTRSFGIYEKQYFSLNSNVSVSINASAPLGNSSEVIVCIFDNQEHFQNFITDEDHWKQYIRYAVYCNSTVVSTDTPTLSSVLNFNFKTEAYYSIGLGSYDLISYLDVFVRGDRYRYDAVNLTRVNCTLRANSDPPCQLPMLSTGGFPCVLAHAVPSSDDTRGFFGLQLTSSAVMTSAHAGVTIVLPVAAIVIVLAVLVVMCSVSLWKCVKSP